jgi:hypothetical protein
MYDSSKLIFGNMDMVVNFRRFTCENRTIMDEKQSKSSQYTTNDHEFIYLLKNQLSDPNTLTDKERKFYYNSTKL